MKKSKIALVLGIVTLLVLLSFWGAKTFSKYTTTVSGTGTSTVAKWSFKANSTSTTMTTINLAETYTLATLKNNRIAPGTEGKFQIEIDATGSEVGVDYKIEFLNEVNKPTNLKFTYEGTQSNTVKGLESVLKGRMDANGVQKKTLTIQWSWPYETTNGDNIDTAEGLTALNYTFDVRVTGTQVLPTV